MSKRAKKNLKKKQKKKGKKSKKIRVEKVKTEARQPGSAPRIIRELAGGWRIEEWYVLLVPTAGASEKIEPVMFFKSRVNACKEWCKNAEYTTRGKVRPVHMLVGPLLDYGLPVSNMSSIGVETKVRLGHFAEGFPQATWNTY